MRWPHGRTREHRSRWPPSVAVRQTSMAYSTRRCSHVNQDRCFAMKLLPCARMMSATSKGGRFIFFAAFATASPGPGSEVRRYRSGTGRAEMTFGKMQVEGGVLELGMPEQHLHRRQIAPRFQQMGRVAVPQAGADARLW